MTLAKGIENKIEFIIKAKGSVDPILLDALDTFTFKVIDYKDNSIITTCVTPTTIALTDLVAGLITITISQVEADKLAFSLRPVEDGNIPKTRYYGILDCDTNVLGKMRVHISEIKVIPNGV